MRINKQVITDYFGSFFKQYSPLSKGQFNKIRALVDQAQCGCCNTITVYFDFPPLDSEPGDPLVHQVRFKDVDDNILASTDVIDVAPQVLCVPDTATQLCINVLSVGLAGTIVVEGLNNVTASHDETVGETCAPIVAIAPAYNVYFTAD